MSSHDLAELARRAAAAPETDLLAGLEPDEVTDAFITPDGSLRVRVQGWSGWWVLPSDVEARTVQVARKLAAEKAARVQEVAK